MKTRELGHGDWRLVGRGVGIHEDERADYEAWVTLRYLDFEPLLALQYRIQRRRLAAEGTLGRPGRRGPQAHAA